MAKGTLQINILGTSFSIQANEDSLYLDKIMRHYRDMVNQVTETTDLKEPIKVAVLAGVMLADEFFKEKKKAPAKTDSLINSAELAEAEKITLKMIKKIDKALE